MSEHALLSPSSMHRWGKCAGSVAAIVAAEIGDTSSEFAREGSAAHVLGERALTYEKPTTFWLGEIISIGYTNEFGNETYQDFTVDEDMCEFVQVYVDQVNREPGELLCEEQFDLAEVYGVDKQFGTGDAVKLDYENERLYVGDLKFGRSRNNIVFAKDNDQMYSYGAGALKQYDMLADWKTITVAVHQPRLNHYDEHTLTRAELEAWMRNAKGAAQIAYDLYEQHAGPEEVEKYKTPGEKQCQWCPIKGACRTLAEWTHEQVFVGFKNLEDDDMTPNKVESISNELLGVLVTRSDIIESACREWRAEGKRRLEAQIKIPGWKLVTGKKGNRKFSSDDEAEEIMKGARIKSDDMYTKKLLTFPAAEKAFKKKKPKVWTKLFALLTQADGAPAMAKESDPRPALVVADESQFEDVSTNDISDLI